MIFQLCSLYVAGLSCSSQWSSRPTQWCSWTGCSQWCPGRMCTWWVGEPSLAWVCGGGRAAAVLSLPAMQCWWSKRGPHWCAPPGIWCCSLSTAAPSMVSGGCSLWHLRKSTTISLVLLTFNRRLFYLHHVVVRRLTSSCSGSPRPWWWVPPELCRPQTSPCDWCCWNYIVIQLLEGFNLATVPYNWSSSNYYIYKKL